MPIVSVSIPSPYIAFLYFLGGQKHEDSKLGTIIIVGKCRLVKVIFSNIHKISDACANRFGRYIMIAHTWLYEKCFYFLLHSSFSVKMLLLGKLKFIYPSTSKRYNNFSAPTLMILIKKFLALSPFKKEGRDYAFYMREYKVETIKLLPFYMTDFLFTEL